MRVALVAEDYYPQLGGVPEHVHNLALQLNSWGHAATVISSHMGSYPDAAFVRRVGTSRVIYSNGGVSRIDRKSTRLNSSHSQISYAVFCLKKKNMLTNTCLRYQIR